MEHATLMLSTTQLGITVASLLILNVSEPAIHHLLESAAAPHGAAGGGAIGIIAFVITLLVVTFLHVVFGEMVPKNIAFSVPDRAVLLLATPLVFVERVFRPIIVALNGSDERARAPRSAWSRRTRRTAPSRSTRSRRSWRPPAGRARSTTSPAR